MMADTELKASIREIYTQVGDERQQRKNDRLREFLARERDQVLQHQAPPSLLPVEPLPSTNDASSVARVNDNLFHVTQKRRGRDVPSQVASVLLPHDEPALPRHLIYTPIQKTFYVSDLEKLTFVPYLGEAQNEEELLLDHDVSHRQELVEKGPLYMEEETNELIDETLKRCSQIKAVNGRTVWEDNLAKSKALKILSDLVKLESSLLEERLKKLLEDTSQEGESTKPPSTAKDCAETNSTDGSDASDTDREYLERLDSYRSMFCRRCFTFNCNLHGILDKPSLDFQTARAREKQKSGAWSKNSLICQPCTSPTSDTPSDAFSEIKELTDFHKMICKRMFIMFEGNVDEMSNAMRAPKHLIREHVEMQGYTLPAMDHPAKRTAETKKQMPYYSVKHYKPKWYKAIEQAEIHPFFFPCVHEGECDDECTCVSNSFFCTNACCWGSASPNFFRGCGCKGSCRLNNCTCFATKRECDPDLCSCGTCCDPPGRPALKQQCRNDNIRMRRHAHLLIGPSTVSGWGLFTKYKIKKGEFIHEYVGELISQEEADRRGQIDDSRNRSYLFNLCSEYSIDASRMGNKTRFINHSATPNCESRTLFVNGDQRIGFFAKEDIEAESELFFDYRYNVAIENELIDKSAVSFDWMKDDDAEKPAAKREKRSGKKRVRPRTRRDEG